MARACLTFFIVILAHAFMHAAAPTIQASAITSDNVGCNSFTINWTNGNGADRICVVYPGAITAPTSGTTYAPNNKYSSGGVLGGGRVVYDGTSNSVTVVGLNANTTYTIVVFEYNAGHTYLTTTTNSITITTETTCSQCPTMTGAVIDACNTNTSSSGACPSCGEGDSEVLFLNSGSYGFKTSLSPPQMDYFSSGQNYIASVTSYVSNAAITASLNAMAGCANSFVDAGNGTVPAYSTIMIVRNTFCPGGYNFSNLCGNNAPIYVLYVSDDGNPSGAAGTNFWKGQGDNAGDDCSSGNFSNHNSTNPTNRYFEWDFSGIKAGNGGTASSTSCDYFYEYNANSLVSCGGVADGAGIAFDGSVATTSATANNPTDYTSCTCTLPIVLPINLLEFKASRSDDQTISIHFTTSSEKDVKKYTLNKSADGFNFYTIDYHTAFNREENTSYFSYDKIDPSKSTLIYYQLTEEDMNGVAKNIGVCSFETKPVKEIIVSSDEAGISIRMPVAAKSIELLALDGKNITYVEGNDNDLLFQINLEGVAKGFYLLRITDINGKVTSKKIIH